MQEQSKKLILSIELKTLIIYLCFFSVAVSPFAFKVLGVHDSFSSQIGLLFQFVLLVVCYLICEWRNTSKWFLILLLLNVLFLGAFTVINQSVGVVLIHFNTLLTVFILNNVVFKKNQCAFLHLCFSVFIFLWVLSLDFTQVERAWVSEPNGLYVNPCTAGILSLAGFYHTYVFVDIVIQRKKFIKFIIKAILFVFAFYFINLSNCRASLLSFLLFFVLKIICKSYRNKYKKITIIFLLLSILFVFAYILLYKIVGRFEFLGKNFFTGRQDLWLAVLDNIKNNFIFGVGPGNTIEYEGVLMDDSHNFLLGVWKNIGLLPIISLFIVFSKGKNVENISKINLNARLMFLTCFVVSSVETVINGAEYYLFFLTLLITVRDKQERSALNFVDLKRYSINHRALNGEDLLS